jgi:hypothetical protein
MGLELTDTIRPTLDCGFHLLLLNFGGISRPRIIGRKVE